MRFAHFAHLWGKQGMTPGQRYEQLWRELQLATSSGSTTASVWSSISLHRKAGCPRLTSMWPRQAPARPGFALAPWVTSRRFINPFACWRKWPSRTR